MFSRAAFHSMVGIVLLSAAQLASSATPTLLVLPFSAPEAIDSEQLPIASFLEEAVLNQGSFKLVDREGIRDIDKELKLNSREKYVDPTHALQYGKINGARYILSGKILALDVDKKSHHANGINAAITVYQLKVQASIIETETSAVVFKKNVTSTHSTRQQSGTRFELESVYTTLAEQCAEKIAAAIEMQKLRFQSDQS